ncbi:hypothetical protein P9112_008854 [Eukaryota sp. TZLM1-RC]
MPGQPQHISVALRIRPPLPTEKLPLRVTSKDSSTVLLRQPGNPPRFRDIVEQYSFEAVFDDSKFPSSATAQEEVFQFVSPLIDSVINGYNSTILAYGATSAGKTYSMGTSKDTCSSCPYCSSASPSTSSCTCGVLCRAVSSLFSKLDSLPHTVSCSLVEVYNDDVNDLLQPKGMESLTIRQDREGNVVNGAVSTTVSSASSCLELITNAMEHRATASTALNDKSSRSHVVVTLAVTVNGTPATNAKLSIVDLAGSERVTRSKASGQRLREATAINAGLLALGNVVSALSSRNSNPSTHVPYRSARLTRLLQDAIGGTAKAVVIVCVGPSDCCVGESKRSLLFGNRLRTVRNNVVRYEVERENVGQKQSQKDHVIDEMIDFQRLYQNLQHSDSEVVRKSLVFNALDSVLQKGITSEVYDLMMKERVQALEEALKRAQERLKLMDNNQIVNQNLIGDELIAEDTDWRSKAKSLAGELYKTDLALIHTTAQLRQTQQDVHSQLAVISAYDDFFDDQEHQAVGNSIVSTEEWVSKLEEADDVVIGFDWSDDSQDDVTDLIEEKIDDNDFEGVLELVGSSEPQQKYFELFINKIKELSTENHQLSQKLAKSQSNESAAKNAVEQLTLQIRKNNRSSFK